MKNNVSAMIGYGKSYFKWNGGRGEMMKKGKIFSENRKNINKKLFQAASMCTG